MKDFEDFLKLSGQGLIAIFLFSVMAVLFNSVDLGINFNPFATLLNVAVSVMFLILGALFIFFVIWIIKEFLEDHGGFRL